MPVSFMLRPPAAVFFTMVLALIASMAYVDKASAQINDTQIRAVYKVNFNGMGLGKVYFNSTVKGRSYSMRSDTKLAMPLLGNIFNSLRWRGITRASGTITNSNKPKPKNYYFSFRNNKKTGKINMDFSGNRISRLTRVPNKVSSLAIPVTSKHLSNIVDPMSALMLMTRTGRSHKTACNHTIPIFDGKQRFNLKLSYKRAVRVKRAQSGGYAGPVVVCRVRYQPIAGHKPHKKDIKAMKANKNIELWLMPLPKSRNYAPYKFVLPLPVGTAKAELAHFDIRKKNGRRIALVR